MNSDDAISTTTATTASEVDKLARSINPHQVFFAIEIDLLASKWARVLLRNETDKSLSIYYYYHVKIGDCIWHIRNRCFIYSPRLGIAHVTSCMSVDDIDRKWFTTDVTWLLQQNETTDTSNRARFMLMRYEWEENRQAPEAVECKRWTQFPASHGIPDIFFLLV